MKVSGKKKDIFIVILALMIILIISGFFLFWHKEENNNLNGNKNKEGPNDFSINGNIVENKREGLKVIIPEGWQVKHSSQAFSNVWGVEIVSPDTEIKKYNPPDLYLINKGCVALVSIEKSNISFDVVNNYLANINEDTRISLFEDKEDMGVIKIYGRLAWKETIRDELDAGRKVEIRIPLESNKLIYFAFISSGTDREFCFEKFSEILKATEIYSLN